MNKNMVAFLFLLAAFILSLCINVVFVTSYHMVSNLNQEYKQHIEVVKKRSQIVNEENYALHTAMKDFASYTAERDAEIANLKEENKILYFQLESELAKQVKWF